MKIASMPAYLYIAAKFKIQQVLLLYFFHLIFLDWSKKYPKRTPCDEIMCGI